MSPDARPAVVLLSGGLDSATALAVARHEGFRCHALTIAYGHNPVAVRASGELLWTWLIPVTAAIIAFACRRGRPWLPASLLVFALAAFAENDHKMSSEAKLLDVDPVEKQWFGPDAKYDDKQYNAQDPVIDLCNSCPAANAAIRLNRLGDRIAYRLTNPLIANA